MVLSPCSYRGCQYLSVREKWHHLDGKNHNGILPGQLFRACLSFILLHINPFKTFYRTSSFRNPGLSPLAVLIQKKSMDTHFSWQPSDCSTQTPDRISSCSRFFLTKSHDLTVSLLFGAVFLSIKISSFPGYVLLLWFLWLSGIKMVKLTWLECSLPGWTTRIMCRRKLWKHSGSRKHSRQLDSGWSMKSFPGFTHKEMNAETQLS